MPLKKLIHGIKKLNGSEHLKGDLSVKKHLDEIQNMGWEKFWKLNNRFVKMMLWIIAILTVYGLIRNSIVSEMTHNGAWAVYFFVGTCALYSAITFYVIHFYLTVGIKMDFNTDNFTRVKMTKMKGIDWKSAEAPYNKKKD